jgi:hypothetical protein
MLNNPMLAMIAFGGGELLLIPLFIILFFIFIALFQWLWNITMPDVFNLKAITYWQAFRLILIAGILFGGTHYSGK